MGQSIGVTAMARVIELSIAPVFLLSAIGAILAVMTGRLARIVDRARVLQSAHDHPETTVPGPVKGELATLSHRAHLISTSITLCTITALLIALVIAILFVGAFLKEDTSIQVAWLFIAGMVTFFIALLLFLREIMLATATLDIGLRHAATGEHPVSR